MKFGVLGPYLISPGYEHRIRAAKHRSLLAILTVNPNAFVTVERLAEELWSGDPPASALNLVRQYVSAIRRELPDGPIVTLPGGYRLDLRPGDLDLHEFDQRVADARQAVDGGRTEEAYENLSRALALWRGDPLGDVEQSPSITAEARRLVERRLSALEQRVDLDLHRGHYDAALDELAALVTLYPQREGLRVRQMRALYATGRRADALAAFREGRDALVERVGIEPGPQLQQVHRQILSDDLTIEARSRTPDKPRPAQLPPDLPDLVARDAELAAVFDTLHRPGTTAPVLVVSGKAGVGKSVLAVHAGHRLRERFPDGQLFLPLTPGTPSVALRRALRALGVPSASDAGLQELRESYAERLRDRRVLVVVDDAVHESDVRPLVPPGAGSALVVTSRSVLSGVEGARHLVCHPLTENSAVAMLSRIIGEHRTAADPDAVRTLVRSVGRLPLALRIAGGRLLVHRHRPVRQLLQRLHLHNVLDELSHGDLAVRPRLAESLRYLSPAELRVFRRVGVRRSFDVDTAAAVAELQISEAARAVDRLLEIHLVEPLEDNGAGEERFTVDALVRAYARERLVADEPSWARQHPRHRE